MCQRKLSLKTWLSYRFHSRPVHHLREATTKTLLCARLCEWVCAFLSRERQSVQTPEHSAFFPVTKPNWCIGQSMHVFIFIRLVKERSEERKWEKRMNETMQEKTKRRSWNKTNAKRICETRRGVWEIGREREERVGSKNETGKIEKQDKQMVEDFSHHMIKLIFLLFEFR